MKFLSKILFVLVVIFASGGLLANDASALKLSNGTQWSNTAIKVCWLNPKASDSRWRQVVKSAVESSWEAVAAVDFHGWRKCTQRDVRTSIILDAGDRKVGVIGPNDGLGINASRIQLNFTFNRWPCAGCRENRGQAIRFHAIHEFGHLLGFDHEHSPYCPSPIYRFRYTRLSQDDPNSIMRTCYQPGFEPRLSRMDIESVQQVYGKSWSAVAREFEF